MKKYFYISILFISAQLCARTASAQEPFTFTQYMNNLTPVNAAYSTMDSAPDVTVAGRKQLIGINGAPNTLLFNGSMPFQNIGATAGLVVLDDRETIFHNTEINAFFAKKVQLSGTNFLSASINAGFRYYKANYSSVDSSDPSFKNDITSTIPNIGFAAMLFGSNYFVGVSLPRLSFTTPVTSTNLKNSYYLTAGYIAPLNEDFKIKPTGMLSYAGSNLNWTYDVSATLYIKDVVGIGANYTNDSNIAGILSVFISNNVLLGYSYQASASNHPIGGINNTTQEITLSYRFGKNLASKLL